MFEERIASTQQLNHHQIGCKLERTGVALSGLLNACGFEDHSQDELKIRVLPCQRVVLKQDLKSAEDIPVVHCRNSRAIGQYHRRHTKLTPSQQRILNATRPFTEQTLQDQAVDPNPRCLRPQRIQTERFSEAFVEPSELAWLDPD